MRGATLVELTVVLPLLLLVTMIILHSGLYFYARNLVNHATFMAGRAGIVQNASRAAMRTAYVNALIPLYGGGLNNVEIQAARDKAANDVSLMEGIVGGPIIDVLNPSKLSFDDWSDPNLFVPDLPGRAIPNAGLEFASTAIKPLSRQSIQDANLLRIRVIHLYEPKVPLVMAMYQALISPADPRLAAAVNAGRLPIVVYATLQMQSDPVEN